MIDPLFLTLFFTGINLAMAWVFYRDNADVFFGAGTVPALFLVAKLADLSWVKSREAIYKIGATAMILVGIYFVIKGIRF